MSVSITLPDRLSKGIYESKIIFQNDETNLQQRKKMSRQSHEWTRMLLVQICVINGKIRKLQEIFNNLTTIHWEVRFRKVRTYTSELPSISFGWGNPISVKIVGVISASIPFSLSFSGWGF